MAKTTVIIDDALLEEAMRLTGDKTKKGVITAGLEELVKKKNLEAFRRELGTFDLDITPEELRELRDEQ